MEKMVAESLIKKGGAVRIRVRMMDGVHRYLIGFLYDMEKWDEKNLEIIRNDLDMDFENIEPFEDYYHIKGKKYDIHIIVIGGKRGDIEMVISPLDSEAMSSLLERIKEYFVVKSY